MAEEKAVNGADEVSTVRGRAWFLLRMVWRFLFRSQSVGVLPYLTIFAFLSISIGVATLIIVLSVMNGFSTTLQEQLVGVYSPIRVYSLYPGEMELNELKEKLDGEDIEEIVGVVEGDVLFQSGRENYAGGRVIAYTSWREGRLPVEKPPETGIYLGRELARELFVRSGEELTVIRPDAQRTPFGLLPSAETLRVEGDLRTGFQDVDAALGLVSIEQARQLFDLTEGKVSHAELWIEDRFRADVVKQELQDKLADNYNLVTWMEANPALFEALRLERTVTFIVLALIVIVAAINILCMLVLSILQRRRQIAMMMSMGASPAIVLSLFLTAGMLITVIGLAAGFGVGLTGCWLLDNVFVIELPPVYPMAHLPVQVETFHLIAIGVVTLLLGFLSSFYPAWAAAKIDPAEVLRYG